MMLVKAVCDNYLVLPRTTVSGGRAARSPRSTCRLQFSCGIQLPERRRTVTAEVTIFMFPFLYNSKSCAHPLASCLRCWVMGMSPKYHSLGQISLCITSCLAKRLNPLLTHQKHDAVNVQQGSLRGGRGVRPLSTRLTLGHWKLLASQCFFG